MVFISSRVCRKTRLKKQKEESARDCMAAKPQRFTVWIFTEKEPLANPACKCPGFLSWGKYSLSSIA